METSSKEQKIQLLEKIWKKERTWRNAQVGRLSIEISIWCRKRREADEFIKSLFWTACLAPVAIILSFFVDLDFLFFGGFLRWSLMIWLASTIYNTTRLWLVFRSNKKIGPHEDCSEEWERELEAEMSVLLKELGEIEKKEKETEKYPLTL